MIDLIKKGGGTVVCQSTCQPTTISSGIKVQGGTWKLGASNIWPNARPLTLDGGAIAGANNTTNAIGVLTVGANGGGVELGAGTKLSFAASSGATWSGDLVAKNFAEGSIRFGNSDSGLNDDQKDEIFWYDAQKDKSRWLRILKDGHLTALVGMRIVIK